MPGLVHVGAAAAALVLGALVLASRKGTPRHRALGGCYATVLLLVNVAALVIPRRGAEFGPFHVLAIVSLGTLVAGLVPLWLMTRSEAVVAFHAITMSFSYVGLVAAGLSQAAAQALPDSAAVSVVVASAATFAIGAVVIFARVPRAVQGATLPTGMR